MTCKKIPLYLFTILVLVIGLCASEIQATTSEDSSDASVQKLIIAISRDTVPFHFIDEKGHPAGIIADLWRLWSQKTGIAVEFKSAPWNETLAMVRDGRVDVHAGLNYNKERDEFFDFSSKWTNSDSYVFFHNTIVGIDAIDDLKPFRVGILKGAHEASILRSKLSTGTLIEFPGQDELYDAVKRGDIKVFADIQQTAKYFLSKRKILHEYNLIVENPLGKNAFYPAVREGNARISALIERGFQSISDQERAKIERTWILPDDESSKNVLIVACDRDYPPFTQLGVDGKAYGMLIDLWRLWAEKTGHHVEFLMTDWPNTLTALEDGTADFHSGLFHTAERSLWLHFSKQIYEAGSAIFFLPDHGEIAASEDLSGQKVGAIRESYQADYLGKRHPEMEVIEFDSYSALIEAAERGLIKAFVDETQRVKDRMFHRYQRGQFKALEAPRLHNQIHAATLLENAELIANINSGLSRINPEEWQNLEKRWIIDPADRIYAPKQKNIELSPREIAWLAAHPNIRLGVDPAYPPYSFVNDKGQFSGVSADFVQILKERLGIEMTMVPGLNWDDILEGAKQGTIDVITTARKTPQREEYLNFSQSYIPTPLIVITRKDFSRIKSRWDIEGEKIALVRGYASHEQIARDFPNIETFWYAKSLYALQAVSTGKADAYIGSQGTSSYLINNYTMTNLKVAAIFDDSTDGQRFAVRKDWPELAGIIDKTLDTISESDRFKIMSQWITMGLDLSKQKKIVLTKEEKAWLADKKDIRLGVDPAWPPFEYFDKTKVYAGIASDYVQILNKRLKINMAPVAGLNWSQVMEKAKAGQIDVLPCVVKTPERSAVLVFTRPYLSFPMVILTRVDAPYVSGIMDFESEKIAIVKSYATAEILKRNFPDRKFYQTNDIDEALRAVSKGKVDAFVGNLASISYGTQKLGLTNLKVATTTPYNYELSLAVRKDWPELIDILNKTLETVSDTDSANIHNRWINVRFERQFDWMTVLKIVGPIILAGGFALFIFIRWNRALTREVDERKKVEHALVESRATARGLLDATQESLMLLNRQGTILAVNHTTANRLGKTPEDLVGANRFDMLPSEVRKRRKDIFDRVMQTGTPADFEDTRGGIVYRSSYYPVKDKAGEIVGVAIFAQDITKRKRAEEALRESEERLKNILVTSNEGFWMIDNDARTVDVNDSMCQLLGRPREQIIGKKVTEFLDKENTAILNEQIAERRKGRMSAYELAYLLPDGSTVPCLLNATPLLDAEGNKVGSFAMVTDITERKQAEEELHRNIEDLERFSRMAVGREERMIELKKEINELMRGLGKKQKYKIVA
jgi:PAS domain S-box-containing protein